MSEEKKDMAEGPEGTTRGKPGGTPGQAENVIREQDLEQLLKKAKKGEGAGTVELEDVGEGRAPSAAGSIDMLMDVSLNVRFELGRTKMSVEEILNLQDGSVVTLEKLAGDPVDVIVNDKLVARGEVLVLNDQFCVRIAEIVSPGEGEAASSD